jgi:hypothetical protein
LPEIISLNTPLITTQTQNNWRIKRFTIEDPGNGDYTLQVVLKGDNGAIVQADYYTPPPPGSGKPSARSLVTALNTANLTNNSLVKRILTQMITDSWITQGTVTGSPD